jgi:hypothetical protein
MAEDIHPFYLPDYRLHSSVPSYDDGACLIRHQYTYTVNDSCCYRWQGIKKAEAQPGRSAYDAHRTVNCRIGKQLVKGVDNFTTGWAPYGNQVHHVLNSSSLRKGIEDVAAVWGHIRRTIVNGLLNEKYNLNHFDNNMICPTADRNSIQTGLPKHLGSHPNYSAKILTAVKKALKPYKAIANQMKNKKDHDKPEPEKLKDALLNISDTMYGNILGMAAANRQAKKATSVDDLPAKAYLGI